MRIAVTYENGNVFQHFGHTSQFKIYDIENGQVVNQQIVDTNGQGHGALAGFLADAKVDVLICGGIGGGAQAACGRLASGCLGEYPAARTARSAPILQMRSNLTPMCIAIIMSTIIPVGNMPAKKRSMVVPAATAAAIKRGLFFIH